MIKKQQQGEKRRRIITGLKCKNRYRSKLNDEVFLSSDKDKDKIVEQKLNLILNIKSQITGYFEVYQPRWVE